MNILIIGSKGFIGSACFEYFSNQHNVIGLDIKGISNGSYLKLSNILEIKSILNVNKFDVCINASGSPGVGYSFDNPDKDYELNVSNVDFILSVIKDYSPNTKFINFSSAAVYGNPANLPLTEDSPLAPLSPYGKHKLESEKLLKEYHETFGIKTCSLRVFSAYGPHLKKQLFWDVFIKWKANPDNICLFGTGMETRDFIHITDLLDAVGSVINHHFFDGGVLNIASGSQVTIHHAVSLFLDFLNRDYQLKFSGEEKIGDPSNWLSDIRKLRELGFSPQIALSAGLKSVANHYISVN
jgi:UDP-glucose 4-epimerase